MRQSQVSQAHDRWAPILGVAALLTAVMGNHAQASLIATLQDIIDSGNSISSTEFEFSNFQFASSLITASDVLVEVGGVSYDISFSTNNLVVEDGFSAEANIAFLITSLSGELIDEITLFTDVVAQSTGSFVLVSEVLDATGEQLVTLQAVDLPSTPNEVSLFLNDPALQITVSKSIRLTAGADGLAQLSFVGQDYSLIPSPGAGSVYAGMLAVFLVRRRRAARSGLA